MLGSLTPPSPKFACSTPPPCHLLQNHKFSRIFPRHARLAIDPSQTLERTMADALKTVLRAKAEFVKTRIDRWAILGHQQHRQTSTSPLFMTLARPLH